jgi:hypothetical protein
MNRYTGGQMAICTERWKDTVTTLGRDYRRGMFTHDSELQAITAISLISTIHKSLHAKSFPAHSVFNSSFLVTDVNSGDSSASRAQVLPSRFQYITACQVSTELFTPILLGADSVGNTPFPRCMCNRCRGNMFTEPLPRNGSNITTHHGRTKDGQTGRGH